MIAQPRVSLQACRSQTATGFELGGGLREKRRFPGKKIGLIFFEKLLDKVGGFLYNYTRR